MFVLLVICHLEELHDILGLERVSTSVIDSLDDYSCLLNLAIHKVEFRGISFQVDQVKNQADCLQDRLNSIDDKVVVRGSKLVRVLIWR